MYNGQLGIDKILHEKYFYNQKNGFFIECGAFDGVIDSNTLFFYKNLNWRGINIEPLPNIFKFLEKNRPHDININAALSNTTGESTFTQAIAPDVLYYDGHFGNGSLSHSKEHMDELVKRKCLFKTYTVKTLTIKELISKYNKSIDLFVLDVEGHELSVLSRLQELERIAYPKVFVVEYGISGLNNIKNLLSEYGYKLDYIDSINSVFIR